MITEARQRSNVVFPAPFGPSRVTTPPPAVSDTSLTKKSKLPPVNVKCCGVLSKLMKTPPTSFVVTEPEILSVNSAVPGVVPGGAVNVTSRSKLLPT